MKKKITTISLLLALGLFAPPPSLRADDANVNIEEPINPMESSLETPEYVAPNEYNEQMDEAEEEYSEPQGMTVSPETGAAKQAERKEFYKNIALAALAVVVAVVSIIVVSNNNGSKS